MNTCSPTTQALQAVLPHVLEHVATVPSQPSAIFPAQLRQVQQKAKVVEGRKVKVLKINVVSRAWGLPGLWWSPSTSGLEREKSVKSCCVNSPQLLKLKSSSPAAAVLLLYSSCTPLYSSSVSEKKKPMGFLFVYLQTRKFPGGPFADRPLPWGILSALLSPSFSPSWGKYHPLEKTGPNRLLENTETNEWFLPPTHPWSYVHRTILVESTVLNCIIYAYCLIKKKSWSCLIVADLRTFTDSLLRWEGRWSIANEIGINDLSE